MDQKTSLNGLRLIFFGSGDFATIVLKKIIDKGVKFLAIVTLPPRPKGRGRKLRDPEVKEIAKKAGIPVFQPQNPNEQEFLEKLYSIEPDFIVLTDYGKILKKQLLDVPEYYPLNIHPSLLPEYRGAAPIERAMMDCREETGVSLMVMDEGLDTGPIVLQERLKIRDTEIKTELMPRLADIGVKLVLESLVPLKLGELKPFPQQGKHSYAKKIQKEELWINWEEEANRIKCRINALSTKPGAKTNLGNILVKLIRARVHNEISPGPGKIIIRNDKLLIGAIDYMVEILEIQPQGKKIMTAEEFLRGYQRKLPTV